jgi:lipoate-protein ligase A
MFKTPIKGEGQIVDEYKELSDKAKLHEAQTYIKSLRSQVSNLEDDAMRYRRMRMLEVVIMAEDGAKYLKGHDLDEYLDSLPTRKGPITRADLLKELTPALNNIFGEEYAKYEAEHGEEFEKLASKEAVFNDKT